MDKSGVDVIHDNIQDCSVMNDVSQFSRQFLPVSCEITCGKERLLRNNVIKRKDFSKMVDVTTHKSLI